ncbi:MAG TPA: hypothetical protein VK640_06335 [Actinomycetes bacterium]|nr:hypothetical protein [Actinomycetes bacterium]
MTLSPSRDASAADWIVRSDLPWARLVTLGPAGFDAYARLRFLPDPVRRGQVEFDLHPDGRPPDQAARLLAVLAGHTATPDDCLVAVWDGLGAPPPGTDAPAVVVGPAERAPHRSYRLFRGLLADLLDTTHEWPGTHLVDGLPAFVWPADQAWCVARDVDPHWAGIGGTAHLLSRLLTDPGLDVVPADPAEEQPAYG